MGFWMKNVLNVILFLQKNEKNFLLFLKNFFSNSLDFTILILISKILFIKNQ